MISMISRLVACEVFLLVLLTCFCYLPYCQEHGHTIVRWISFRQGGVENQDSSSLPSAWVLAPMPDDGVACWHYPFLLWPRGSSDYPLSGPQPSFSTWSIFKPGMTLEVADFENFRFYAYLLIMPYGSFCKQSSLPSVVPTVLISTKSTLCISFFPKGGSFCIYTLAILFSQFSDWFLYWFYSLLIL